MGELTDDGQLTCRHLECAVPCNAGVMFSRRWRYDELEAPTPLGTGQEIRLPYIDLKSLTGGGSRLVGDIEAQAVLMAEELQTGGLPSRALEYGEQLCRGFDMSEGAEAREWVDRWLRVGWAVGTVEETSGAARPGRSERHHLTALARFRGRLYNEVEQAEEEGVKACADAYFLALFGGYYLRREPNATADSIVRGWRAGR
jgi:hypothetical protein